MRRVVDDGDASAGGGERHTADGGVVERHRAGLGVELAGEDGEERRLAGAVGTDDGDAFRRGGRGRGRRGRGDVGVQRSPVEREVRAVRTSAPSLDQATAGVRPAQPSRGPAARRAPGGQASAAATGARTTRQCRMPPPSPNVSATLRDGRRPDGERRRREGARPRACRSVVRTQTRWAAASSGEHGTGVDRGDLVGLAGQQRRDPADIGPGPGQLGQPRRFELLADHGDAPVTMSPERREPPRPGGRTPAVTAVAIARSDERRQPRDGDPIWARRCRRVVDDPVSIGPAASARRAG